jgi:tRNA-dihydrouridine synthase
VYTLATPSSEVGGCSNGFVSVVIYTHTTTNTFSLISYILYILYTGDAMRFLQADLPAEEPLVLQLGGSDPEQMRVAAGLAVGVGYREINVRTNAHIYLI